ncbi:hypothetical protein [Roseateles sp. P5_D6]
MKYLLALLLCVAVCAAAADSWQAPEVSGHASPKGERVIRVIPGTDMGAVFGFAGAQRGHAAKARVYRLDASGNYKERQEVQLVNPISPVFAAIADSGELITLDNWHNMGIGPSVIVVYSPDGKVVRSLGLEDLYSPAELQKFRLSSSSVWWRCGSEPRLDARGPTLELMDALGATLEVHLKTGEVKRSATSQAGC